MKDRVRPLVLEAIDKKLNQIVHDDIKHQREDIWQQEFVDYVQARNELTIDDYYLKIKLLQMHLDLLVSALFNKRTTDQNDFFDITISINGVSYVIPLAANIANNLKYFIDEELQ